MPMKFHKICPFQSIFSFLVSIGVPMKLSISGVKSELRINKSTKYVVVRYIGCLYQT